MTIGTSLGHHYQDEHHYQARDFESDIQKSVNKAVKDITWEDDPDLIRNPIEISPADTSPLDEMGTNQMQMQKASSSDPGNIYNDAGEIVDYKEGGQWGTPDLPTRKTDQQIRDENNALH